MDQGGIGGVFEVGMGVESCYSRGLVEYGWE